MIVMSLKDVPLTRVCVYLDYCYVENLPTPVHTSVVPTKRSEPEMPSICFYLHTKYVTSPPAR